MLDTRPIRLFARSVPLGAVVLLLVAVGSVAVSRPAVAATAVAMTFEVSGAQGGAGGGAGGTVVASATLDAGTQISVYVGGSGGWNGGGRPGTFVNGSGDAPGSYGGGASDVRIGGSAVGDRKVVAGGGGGHGGGSLSGSGGAGGAGGASATNGSNGVGTYYGRAGVAGSASAGGSGGGTCPHNPPGGAGASATGGNGGNTLNVSLDGGVGGGGGGGWYGGGGGGAGCIQASGAGGGGGSSHVDGSFTTVSSTSGTRSGDGLVRVSLDGGSTWVATFAYTGAVQTYTVPEPPQPSSVDPSAGPAAGGTPVTLSGSGLTDTSAVLVCGEAATDLSVADDSTVSFTTPSGPVGTCDVAVQTSASGSATLADGFRYFATPEVTSVEPGDGPPVGGTQVTVTGSGFTGATSVTFGGTAATDVDVIDDSTVVATSPAHAPGAVDVVVTTPDASGTRSGAFTYYAPPTSLAVSPVAGPTEGGTAITVTGSGLAATSGVTIGGAAVTDLVVVDDSTVTAMTPAGPLGGADVVVTTDGGSTTLADGFTYAEAPEVHVGAGTALWGSTLEVDGEGFAPGSEVSLTLHSTPVHLATVTAGDDGRFTTRVTIPDVEAGLHHLLLDGVDPLGEPVSVQTTITVTAPFETGGSTSTDAAAADPAPTGAPAPVSAAEPAVAADGTLPKTGTDPMGPLATGLGLLVVGSGICVTRRRRLS